ncbi:NADH:ubiquinone oxidoreductase 17.2 kD subunit [Rubellimicrobium thermophilum DSM 16684]|uniref:NADH:ubiquinone oxidoreductase 17.2 kD subunit n=1 Tax=Rubellimicrobium thermophilum DSM 16684 TaxID=1123069 RepID=S9R3J2_9RHOB|nr:NADH:ubiquinone oxidoreductase subunit NDUFA12 [Rubellimicrobium thermophilum]EPX86482.1 NADH:ubiquinone oxidoreductase 17.2 kD subunit [Rubellimicrobium thermophilum DSM 16684]
MGFWTAVRRIFTWWDGQTYGTQLWTRRHGVKVGEDEFGNIYYRSRDGRRRWVIYNGEAEASRVPPDWFGWLHRNYDEAPSEKPLRRKPWEKPHLPNLTGTDLAYAPPGSLRRPDPVERRDYEAWMPD